MLDLTNLSPPSAAASFVKDTDDMRAEADLFEASMAAPVLALFHSAGSAIARQLEASLTKLIAAQGGKLTLARVNIQSSPGLAQALRIQSVPTVYVFWQGKPVDGFVGSRPEPELKAMIDKLAKLGNPAAPEDNGAEVKKMIEEGDAFFKQGQSEAAMERYGAALDLDAGNMAALGGIGWCLLEQGDAESVQAMLADLTPEQKAEPRLKGLHYVLALGGTPAALIDTLVAEVKKNREGGAKEKLLELFEALGPAHPLTGPGRRKLSAVIFS